ncbi:MAG TPA: plastocyanin/azurin family copper-binding protein, partial [Mycobacteriales bacterium]|nr:plastocyanin/azurin family copper-binding protein [Mycobacteriales bacterium]
IVRAFVLSMSTAVLATTVAACGGSSGGTSGAGTGSTPSAAGTAAGPAQHPTQLVADVGHDDAFSISLNDQDGKPIRKLAAGTYKLVVNDESSIHNFHLMGGSVDKSTTVSQKGKQTFTVTFSAGSYSFMCDPHARSMHGDFTVS